MITRRRSGTYDRIFPGMADPALIPSLTYIWQASYLALELAVALSLFSKYGQDNIFPPVHCTLSPDSNQSVSRSHGAGWSHLTANSFLIKLCRFFKTMFFLCLDWAA